jgi:MFS transporter, DHA2 family, multidrug resistance protein
VPESRAAERPGLDLVGLIASVAGLVGMTYGLIQAGQNGWGDARALVPLIAGFVVLVGFFLWEHWLGLRPGGQPLVDLALFRSASFTWGVILVATAVLAMIGVLFTLPQFFQGVLGTDAMGSGVRLLPLIGGLIVGAIPADRIARVVGAKITVALGFALLVTGMLLGATTGVGSSGGFIAVWMAIVGAGMGLAMATAASAALSELPQERSGVGSAVMQALQKVGAPFGVAILGSVLISAYQGNLHLVGLPPVAAKLVQESVFGGIAVAQQLGSAPLLESVRLAFAQGMDVALLVSAGIAAAGIVLALAFFPGRAASQAERTIAVEASPDRRRALLGLLLALLASEAQKPEADPTVLAALSSAVDGRFPHDWSEEQRGRAVAQEVIEPLSILLLASSASGEAENANGGAAAGEMAPGVGEMPSTSSFIGS